MSSRRQSTRIARQGDHPLQTSSSVQDTTDPSTAPRTTRSRAARTDHSSTGGSSSRAALDNPAGLFRQRLAELSQTLDTYRSQWQTASEDDEKAREGDRDVPTPSTVMLELVEDLQVFQNDLAIYELEVFSECVSLPPGISQKLSNPDPNGELLSQAENAASAIKRSPVVWRDGEKGKITASFRKDALQSALEDFRALTGEESSE